MAGLPGSPPASGASTKLLAGAAGRLAPPMPFVRRETPSKQAWYALGGTHWQMHAVRVAKVVRLRTNVSGDCSIARISGYHEFG